MVEASSTMRSWMQMVARVEDSMQIPAFRDQPAPLIINRDRLGPPFNFLLYLTPLCPSLPDNCI